MFGTARPDKRGGQMNQVVTMPFDEERRVSLEDNYAITQHYYSEAHLFQTYQHREWLEKMVAQDVHYWMPVTEERFARDKRPGPKPGEMAIYDDDYDALALRISRLETGQVWMEDPRPCLGYMVNNVEAFYSDGDMFDVRSNVSVQRNRRQYDETRHLFFRKDQLTRKGAGFQLIRRHLWCSERVVNDKNLYFFV